ncbi:tartrate dehydrogenase [Rugosimonospora acidiphila]|uniref:Tartrate dehydrogenase n=1 Tax=Rugosimonospora acidiphila TaxID=556531 RepID=A0ABP9SRL2_9ACTN
MSRVHSIAAIAGDGIGQEVMPPAVAAVDACGRRHGFTVDWTHYDWGSQRYRETGYLMPEDGIEQLKRHDAILFGAVGAPDIPDTTTLWGLLMPMRRQFNQYVNLRPVRHIAGVPSPLADPAGIDIVVIRENVEGEYSEVGGRGGPDGDGYAVQASRFTRDGVTRVAAYAAELASRRSGTLTSATKSNGILHTMPFWDEHVARVAAGYPDLKLRSVLIDALAAALILRPRDFDVIVASNLFGDILSDLTAALVGSLGLAASANLNPERAFPSLFEPVHGSAPDIAGTGVANPAAMLYAAAMMLDHLGETDAGTALTEAVDATLRDGPRSRDLGGAASTAEVAAAVTDRLTRA